MKNIFFAAALMLAAISASQAQTRIEYQPADSAEVERLLSSAPAKADAGSLMLYFGHKLEGRPYVAHTLEAAGAEHLVVNLRGLDCTTFVENSAALTLASLRGERSFAGFCRALQGLRYHGGAISGYASRLHYFSEWIADNARRGNVADAGKRGGFPFTAVQEINVSFMSLHPDLYDKLRGDTAMQRLIAKNEKAVSGACVNYIPKKLLSLGRDKLAAAVHDGDILALVTTKQGLDISHVGIAEWRRGKLHLLNASSIYGKVVLDQKTLYEYQMKRASQMGVRVIRLTP